LGHGRRGILHFRQVVPPDPPHLPRNPAVPTPPPPQVRKGVTPPSLTGWTLLPNSSLKLRKSQKIKDDMLSTPSRKKAGMNWLDIK